MPRCIRLMECVVIASLAIGCGSPQQDLMSGVRRLPPRSSDGGVKPEDAGIPEPDAGQPEPDAGQPAIDGGSATGGPPYPIVLMHGMGGFNQLENLPLTVSYFNDVQADLEAHGVTNVFVTVTLPFDTSENRAAMLAPQLLSILRQTGAAKLNLIGHSQGGLDARVLASPAGLNMGDVIASVTTVGTPHQGTPAADLGMDVLNGVPSWLVGPVSGAFLQLLEDGFYPDQPPPNLLAQCNEMTTSYMAQTFNPKYVDAPGVIYQSYAGRTNLESGAIDCDSGQYPNDPQALDLPQPVLAVTADFIQLLGLQNDGLVPVNSAKWGTFMQCVPADHLKEVGLLFQNGPDPLSGFDHLVFFETIVARLRAQGL